MRALRNCSLLAACALAACGGNNGRPGGGPDAGYGAYVLKLVGNPVQTLHPNEKRTLQVILAQDQIGAVPNADIQFAFQDGDPGSAKIDSNALKTDTGGAATINLTAGSASNGFKLVASAPGFPQAGAVAFSVQVTPVRRLLQIEGSPQVIVASGGDSAQVTIYTSSSIGLKVREVDKDTGSPIAGDTLSFTLGPSNSYTTFSGGSSQRSTSAVTNAGGEAVVFILSGSKIESKVLVTAQTASPGSQGSVSYGVTVNDGGGNNQSCTNSQQCPAGEVCINGHCTASSPGACGSGTDNPCPFGYVCGPDGICHPPAQRCQQGDPNACPSGQCCGADGACVDVSCSPACGQNQHCESQGTCGPGICVPNPVSPPDVTGVWYSRHGYDISQALPTVVRDIFKALRYIDQAIVGKLNLPPWLAWLNPLISKILKQYIPPWVQTIIRIGDDIGVILSMLRSEGAMRLNKGADFTHVKGSEVWTSLVFYWLPLCGDNIGGDPDVPPPCARFDIATTDSDNPGEPPACKGQSIPTIAVKVGPITAEVAGDGTAAHPWRINVDQRQVNLQMGKVVLIIVNELLTLTTPYHCIDEATDCTAGPCIVDCPGLGQWVDGWAPGFGGTIEVICDNVVKVAGQEATKLLNNITFDTDVLDFKGSAVIPTNKIGQGNGVDNSLCQSGANCAGQLGMPDYATKLKKDVNHRDGQWTGSFFLKVISNMPGAWEAEREPFAPQAN